MNTTENNNNNTAAPSVTIAPRNPARGVLNFVVTLTTHKDVRSYPCRSMESAIKLAERFIAGVTKPARPTNPERAATSCGQDKSRGSPMLTATLLTVWTLGSLTLVIAALCTLTAEDY